MAIKKITVDGVAYDIDSANKVDLDTPFEGAGELVVAQNSGSVKGAGVDISEVATKTYVSEQITNAIRTALKGDY